MNISLSANNMMMNISNQNKAFADKKSEGKQIKKSGKKSDSSVSISREGMAKLNMSKGQESTDINKAEEYKKIPSDAQIDLTGTIEADFHKRYTKLNSKTKKDDPDQAEFKKNAMSVYTDMLNEIKKGYADGTRKIYIADSGSESGYRIATEEEKIAALDAALEFHNSYTDAYMRFIKEDKETMLAGMQRTQNLWDSQRSRAMKVSRNTEGLELLNSDEETGNYSFRFTSPAYVYRAIEKGFIRIDGKEIILDEETKDKLKNAADEVFKVQEAAIKFAVAEHNMMVAQQQGEAISESLKEEQKLLKIALRIMKGGKVPAQDEDKLAQGNPAMYQMAKNVAAMKKDKENKEYDSVDKDDKSENGSENNGAAAESMDSPMKHIDRHYVDIGVSLDSTGSGIIDSVSTETVIVE
ncbi:MAG: hypothetical protein K5894_02845 [Lachnospiraceae bacterium]|nr:hypothetical protein [Lachnospiraceae bacterium]